MRCTCFDAEPAALVAALTEPDTVARWQANLADELPSLADRALQAHLRALARTAAAVLSEGFDVVCQRDVRAVDALLSDLLAVATWHGWELPLTSIGERDLPVEDLPRGLLAADTAADGAKVWVLDDRTIALARDRVVDHSP